MLTGTLFSCQIQELYKSNLSNTKDIRKLEASILIVSDVKPKQREEDEWL